MAIAVLNCRAQLGIESLLVTVEVHLSGGLPGLTLVGLPETAVKESKERVRSAILNAGFEYPQRRITINLAPADLPKEGGRYDLAIAIGILQASGQIKTAQLDRYELVSELALSGELRPIKGILPVAIACGQSQRTLMIASGNVDEARLFASTDIVAFKHLADVVAFLLGQCAAPEYPIAPRQESTHSPPDLSEVLGQAQAKRALEIAAAGQLNVLLAGPPGSGKSLLASCLQGILPPLSEAEKLEVASIHSLVGLPVEPAFRGQRPFRRVHHNASPVALVGGGSNHPKPGEITLATQGVLFLDEMPEFSRRTLDLLREPMETHNILISRAIGKIEYPAAFQLIGAMNPCPCGYFQDGSDRCVCTTQQITRYQSRISGPLMDRIDIQLWVSAVPVEQIWDKARRPESSATVRARVEQARAKQLQRQGCTNRHLKGAMLERHASIDMPSQKVLMQALQHFQLSVRACQRIVRVARTLADLEGMESIRKHHILEAITFRGVVGQQK